MSDGFNFPTLELSEQVNFKRKLTSSFCPVLLGTGCYKGSINFVSISCDIIKYLNLVQFYKLIYELKFVLIYIV